VARQHAPLVENLLQNEPVLAITLSDPADEPVLEPAVGETPLWSTVCVTALFPGDTPPEPLGKLLRLLPGVDRPAQVSVRKVADQQWERVWLKRFKPMQFGDNLCIVPGDMASPDGARYVVRLDPGLAFGTGTHPTTRLCLEWLDGHDFEGQTVVDYGCGSGVLGIAAAIKGAARVLCVDHDPQALTATRDNAGRNGVRERIITLTREEYQCTGADVVLANILAGPLIELAPVLLDSLRPGGLLVISGILEQQVEEVISAYTPQLERAQRTCEEGWMCLTGRLLDA